MLKKILIACFFLFAFSIISVSGQTLSANNKSENIGFVSLEMNPAVIVIVDSVNYEIDSRKADEIKNEWIDKVLVMKDETSKKIYGNKNGVILIYTNKDYEKEVLKQIQTTELGKDE